MPQGLHTFPWTRPARGPIAPLRHGSSRAATDARSLRRRTRGTVARAYALARNWHQESQPNRTILCTQALT